MGNKDNNLINVVLITAFDINKYLNNSFQRRNHGNKNRAKTQQTVSPIKGIIRGI